MATALATAHSPEMTTIMAGRDGSGDGLNRSTKVGAPLRSFVTTIPLASQASGTTISIGRVPAGAVMLGFEMVTDTSLGTAQIAFGDYSDTVRFKAAGTFTALNTPTKVGVGSTYGQIVPLGYDCRTGQESRVWNDITMTTSVAALPASGNLTITTYYSHVA
jgi:hypothetical protein